MFTVLVPTRGRPQNIVTQMKALRATDSICTVLYFVDEDDPEVDNYIKIFDGPEIYEYAILHVGTPAKLGPWLNRTAPMLARQPKLQSELIGFMGDDHMPRTHQWDRKLGNACRGQISIAYGNDLFQGPNLPTAVFMSGSIIHALGYMVPADLTHLYIDNAWAELGRQSGTLRYFGNVIIEHMHSAAGKAENDEHYDRVNSSEMYAIDGAKFSQWVHNESTRDAAKIKALMA